MPGTICRPLAKSWPQRTPEGHEALLGGQRGRGSVLPFPRPHHLEHRVDPRRGAEDQALAEVQRLEIELDHRAVSGAVDSGEAGIGVRHPTRVKFGGEGQIDL